MLDAAVAAPPRPGPYAGPERRAVSHGPSRWLARMLDETDHGMLLVSCSGQLHHANRPAWQELTAGRSLRLSNGRVHAGVGDQQGPFAQALADAGRDRRRLVSLGPDGDALPVAAVPIERESGADEALALLVLGKRQGCETLTLDFFARSQGLTGAEARVLQALCSGMRPKEVAHQMGVAVSTIRTQISSIRLKTQTDSIGDLLNRVGTLPPITRAMLVGMSH